MFQSGNQNRPAGVGSEFLAQGAGPGYPAPQPMSYHLNVAAEKNLLMTSSALGKITYLYNRVLKKNLVIKNQLTNNFKIREIDRRRVAGMGSVQGNCRPGYPARPLETSQTLHRVSSSTGSLIIVALYTDQSTVSMNNLILIILNMF